MCRTDIGCQDETIHCCQQIVVLFVGIEAFRVGFYSFERIHQIDTRQRILAPLYLGPRSIGFGKKEGARNGRPESVKSCTEFVCQPVEGLCDPVNLRQVKGRERIDRLIRRFIKLAILLYDRGGDTAYPLCSFGELTQHFDIGPSVPRLVRL